MYKMHCVEHFKHQCVNHKSCLENLFANNTEFYHQMTNGHQHCKSESKTCTPRDFLVK